MNKRILKGVCIGAFILFGGVIAAFLTVTRSARADRNALNAVYQRALYETCELVNGMESNLKKASVSVSASKQIELLNETARQSQGAESNLSMLPFGLGQVNATLKFVNQAGDYAQTLSQKIAGGYRVTPEDRAQMELLTDGCAQLSLGFKQMLENEQTTGVKQMLSSLSQLTGSADDEQDENAVEYPVLLYDGPFSDGAKGDEWKALGKENYTAKQAQYALLEWFGEPVTNVVLTGTSGDREKFYEFEIVRNGQRMFASVSERGGKLIELLPEQTDYKPNLNPEACIEAAKTALYAHGFGTFKESYYQEYRGLLTVNLAPVENGVILYPDTIKAQISMTDGSLVGFEAGNYYRNHVEREWEEVAITAEMAMALISPEITPIDARLCLIPIRQQEELCYEVRAKSGEDEYLIYIDAISGNESAIFQLIPTDSGVLTQ